jgi:hypothetical protein
MTSREALALLIGAATIIAVLAMVLFAKRRRLKDRRSGYQHINLNPDDKDGG